MGKKGFTLVELLIAAAIMASMAVLATNAYKNSMMRSRIEGGKSRTRAVAAAVQRFNADYPKYKFLGTAESHYLKVLDGVGTCNLGPEDTIWPDMLIKCGYLDNRQWSDSYVSIEVCGTYTAGLCKNAATAKPSERYLACMTGTGSKMERYSGEDKYLFCVSARGEKETGTGL